MSGLPPWLTYGEYVAVAMAADRIAWLQTQTLVRALRIAAGDPPPDGYLRATGSEPTPDQAADQRLVAMMNQSLRSRR